MFEGLKFLKLVINKTVFKLRTLPQVGSLAGELAAKAYAIKVCNKVTKNIFNQIHLLNMQVTCSAGVPDDLHGAGPGLRVHDSFACAQRSGDGVGWGE